MPPDDLLALIPFKQLGAYVLASYITIGVEEENSVVLYNMYEDAEYLVGRKTNRN